MRLLIASQIDGGAEAELRSRHDVVSRIGASEPDLAEAARDRHAIVFRSGVSLGAPVLHAPDLRLLVRAGSGLDNLDMQTVSARGIELRRVPGPGAQAVAELTFAHLLALARQLPRADRLLREGHWAKGELDAYNLHGKTLGVIGLGSIGSRVAELGRAWGMRVIGCVDRPSDPRRLEFARRGIELLADCGDVLEQADFVTIHVPLVPSTRGLIGSAELARMKPTAFLVNMARGGVVDEGALLTALTEGRLAGAGLDTHVREGEGADSPLASLPNVTLTPHIGAATIAAQREIGRQVVAIVDGFSREHSL
ncbi:MAG: hydroxyacid dehydrogenase [Chloroflexi bacterium]|nr:hydroxyacid dehydrogenase [Chloroflexota bacterium]